MNCAVRSSQIRKAECSIGRIAASNSAFLGPIHSIIAILWRRCSVARGSVVALRIGATQAEEFCFSTALRDWIEMMRVRRAGRRRNYQVKREKGKHAFPVAVRLGNVLVMRVLLMRTMGGARMLVNPKLHRHQLRGHLI